MIRPGPGHCSLRRLLLAALLAPALAASAAPRIVVEQPSWDFGAVTNATELTHDFLIRNAGDASLELAQVRSSCVACLSAAADKRVVPPGGMARIHCHLDLHALSGRVVRSVVLTCNDAGNPSPVLNLVGVSVPAYEITPLEITLDLSQGQPAGQAEIVPLQKLRAPLSEALSDNTNVVASVRAAGLDRFLLTIEARSSFPRGHWVVNLVARSRDTNDPPCHVLAIIHDPPDLEVLPAELRLQPQPDPQTRILWLKQHGPVPLVLLDAIPSTDRLHCEIEPDPSGPNYKIYVTAWHQDAAAGQTNSVALKLRDQRGRERSLEVSVVVSSGESKGL